MFVVSRIQYGIYKHKIANTRMLPAFVNNLIGGESTKPVSADSASSLPKITKCVEIETDIKANPFTANPDKAWGLIKGEISHEELTPLHLDTPIFENKIRFVCISDTHSRAEKIEFIPAGDILLHAGDFTNGGSIEDVKKFSDFLQTLDSKFKYKVVIAGNHELTFDAACPTIRKFFGKLIEQDENDKKDPREFVKNCIYLEDSMVELYGLKIYGSPWQPTFHNWAFNVERGSDILKKWNKIPTETDILITHGPPLGFGDIVRGGYHAGCCELLSTIRNRVRPKFHIFGHIHEDPGMWTDTVTTFINASTCNIQMQTKNPPIIFDVDLPEGMSK